MQNSGLFDFPHYSALNAGEIYIFTFQVIILNKVPIISLLELIQSKLYFPKIKEMRKMASNYTLIQNNDTIDWKRKKYVDLTMWSCNNIVWHRHNEQNQKAKPAGTKKKKNL